ncbi:hypothetical protein Pmar_PMAR021600 [Perkinsus marinus ATCC 50983]|uniref:Uncharacterized protein n=1 Tax=Perkinsus marinus (strain ATCC 50983 / TXsc) TaxID=423536 RepID=C5L8L3_PERM5|nr:hypothetical protein Pmar_PMAR021600 [Perkinsus marinus ATCC 50983]EER06926.1 hypothetical protein Pmar_PMAR021600 [Perkinsus marinus ATCC 50983]|eukprot:XP_002775110.1 hypothetical protein Pmar_PMAR021600 [Perkinsus marinus ATCC 50983]
MLSAMMATLAEYFDSPIVLQTTSQGTTLVFQVSSAVTWLLRILIPIIVTALYLKLTQNRRPPEDSTGGVHALSSSGEDDFLHITTVSPAQPRPFGSPTRKKIIPPTASSRCSSRASPVVRGVDPRGSMSRGRGGQRSAHERTVQVMVSLTNDLVGDVSMRRIAAEVSGVMAGDDRKGSLDGKASLAGRDAPAPAESPPGLSTAAASTANPATPLTIVPQEEAKHPEPMRLNAKAPEFIPSTGGHGTAPTTRFLDSLMDHRRAVAAARYYQNQVMTARYMGGLAAMAKAQMQAVQLAQAQGAQLSQYHPNAPSMPTMKEDKLLEWSAARAEEQAQVQMRVKRILDENKGDDAKEDPSKKGSTPDEKQPQLRVDVDDLKKAGPERKRELLGL